MLAASENVKDCPHRNLSVMELNMFWRKHSAIIMVHELTSIISLQ